MGDNNQVYNPQERKSFVHVEGAMSIKKRTNLILLEGSLRDRIKIIN